jgi:hypothetical protein
MKMLYTVVPLERIYSCRTESILINAFKNTDIKQENDKVEYRNIDLPHGRVYAKRIGENYIVDGINSTDMSDYLNADYMPGSVVNSIKK